MDLNTIKFTVDTTELTKAKTALNELASAVDVINKAEKELSNSNKGVTQSNKEVQKSTEATTRTFVKQTDVLKKNADVLSFMANGFTKGQASVLAIGKASGLTANQMKELEKVLDSIFKLAGKNPFDDSVDPIKRLRGEIEKTTNQIKVLKGETSLTAKQLNELSVAQARAQEKALQRGKAEGVAQRYTNLVTREFMKLAEESNTLAREKVKLLDESTRKAQQEISVQRAAAKEQASALKEQVRLKELLNKTGRVVELRQEGFSTTSANQIIRAEKSGISGAELEAFRQKRKELDAISKSSLAAAAASNTYRLSVDGLQAAVRAFLPGFGALTGVAIGATAVANIIRIADQFTGLNERLKLVTSSTQELVFVNERLRDIANDSRVPLAETVQLYTRLAPALKQYGGGVEATLGVTEAFGKALAISGANTKEAVAATLQFSQALGSGKLAGDEFRSIAEASPRLLKAIADGTGKTTGELKKLASEGFLTTAKVSQALLSQLTVLELEFARTTPTISQAFTVFSNKGKAFIADLNEATGFTKAFAQGLLSLADSIPSVSSLVQGASNFLKEYRKEIAFVAENLLSLGIAYATIKVGILTNTLLLGGLTAAKRIATSAAVTYAFALKAVELAGGGLVGTLKLLKDGFAALFAVITKNKIAIAIGLISAAVAFAFRDSLISQVDKMTEAFDRFFSKTEEGSVEFNLSSTEKRIKEMQEERVRLERALGKPNEELENKASKDAYTAIKERTDALTSAEFKKLQAGKLTQEQFQKNVALIGQERIEAEKLQKLREESAKGIRESKKEDESTRFTLGNVNKVFEQELSNANRLEQFQKAQIDANLQYRLISEAEAFVQREKLAKDSYERERSLIVAQIAKVQALQIDQNSKTKDSQIEQKKAEEEKLKLKLTQLDVDRKQVEEMARIAFLGKENERRLEAENKLARINADIQQDIQALLQQQANQYKDPAVVAAEQARIKAADKYTEQITRLIAIEKELQEQADRTEDNETWISINEQLDKAVKRTEDARNAQRQYSDEVAKTVRNIAEQNRTLEAGFQRFFRNFENESKDLSKISENFAKGFFEEFDKAFFNIFKSGKFQFGNLFKFIREEIKRLAITKLLLDPIKLAIEPLFTSVSSSVLGFLGIGGAAKTGAAGTAGAVGTGSSGVTLTGLLAKAGKGIADFSDDLGSINVSEVLKKFGDKIGGRLGGALTNSVTFIDDAFKNAARSIKDFVYRNFASSQNATLRQFGEFYNTKYYEQVFKNGQGAGSINFANVAGSVVGSFAGNAAAQKVSGGYETKGFSGFLSSLGPSIGSAIGQALVPIPGVGAAIGGFLGGVSSGIFNRAFGKKTTVSLGASGIEGVFGAEGFSGQAFQDIITTTKKGKLRGGGSRTSVSTQFSALDSAFLETISESFTSLTDSAKVASRILGQDLSEAIDNVRISGRFQVGTQEQFKATLDKLSDEIIKQTIPAIEEFRESGENLIQTANRVATAVNQANNASVLLGQSARFSIDNAESALSFQKVLAEQSKDLENILSKFLPASVLASRQIEIFKNQIKDFGLESRITAEITRQQFSQMLQQIDISTLAGQRELSVLLQLAPAIDSVIKQREDEKSAIDETESTVRSLIFSVQGSTNAFAQADEAINKIRLSLFNTNDVQTKLSLESELANQIVERYKLELELMSALQSQVKDLQNSVASERQNVLSSASSIIGTPLQMNAAQISSAIFAAAMQAQLPTLDRVNAALGVVGSRESDLASVDLVRSSLTGAQSALNESLFAARALANAINANTQFGSAVAMNANGTRVSASFDESTRRVQASDYQYIVYNIGDEQNVYRLRENLNPLFGQIGGANSRISGAQSEVARLTAIIDSAPQFTKALEAAQVELQAAKREFADGIQQFVIDAGKAVNKLSKLREETVKYFEAQQALAQLMGQSAAGLRNTVSQIRFNKQSPLEQLGTLREQFSKTFASASLASGETLSELADSLNSQINPLLELASNVYASGAEFQAIEDMAIRQAEEIAARLEELAPKSYQQESIALLAQIDTQLALIEQNTATAEKLIVDAINLSRDKTLEGLRNIVSAVRGEPVQAFARGGVFTNGVVSKPTFFNNSVMGEAGSEAIMPLTNIGGSLGVRASVSSDNSAVVRAIEKLSERLDNLEQGDINLQVVTTDGKVITEQTIKAIKERSRKGELIVYADGVK